MGRMDTPTEGESPRRRTREEIREENRRRFRLEQEAARAARAEAARKAAEERDRVEAERKAEADRLRAEAEAARERESESPPNVDPVPAVVLPAAQPIAPAPGCDPHAPDAVRQLFGAAYRRLWSMIHDPTLTNMDVIAAFSAARLAAGIGKEAPPPTKYALPMHSLLRPTDGESEGPADASLYSVRTSGHESTELGDDRPQTVQPTGGESPANSPRVEAIHPGSTQGPPDA